MTSSTVISPPDFEQLPYKIYLQFNELETNDYYLTHQHPWGQLSYSASGVMTLTIEAKQYRVPSRYAVWTPPEREHDGHTLRGGQQYTINIDAAWCRDLPSEPCALLLGPIFKAIVEGLAERKRNIPQNAADRRLFHVMLDQVRQSQCYDSYLPSSQDPLLSRLLNALQQTPGNNDTLAQWAERLHTTERTLARRCQQRLGMGLSEWRQRLRFLAALALLDKNDSIQHIALDLGYSTASAFIAMFQRHAGLTPEQYRCSTHKSRQTPNPLAINPNESAAQPP